MPKNIILITGTRKGIGRYLAEYYLKEDHQVIGFSRDECDLKSPCYTHFQLDVGDEHQVKQAFQEIRKKFGRLDVLVNNAAINPTISPFLLVPHDSLKNTFNTNVFGTMNTCREAIKLMMKNGFGRIINMSSMAVRLEVYGETSYTSSKAAVTSFTRILAKEVYGNGITCNVVAPAAIPTELAAAVDQVALKKVLERNAVPDFGKMEDVSNTIDWLIKKESNGITGQVIYLGGV